MAFVDSYIWKLRQKIGHDPLLLPASSIIVSRDDGGILLMKRKQGSRWSLIGGYAEVGESHADTAVRELREETGISVKAEDLIPISSFSDPKILTLRYENDDQVQIFSMCFLLKGVLPPANAILDAEEVDELAFFELDTLPAGMHVATMAEIDLYRRYLQTNQFQVG